LGRITRTPSSPWTAGIGSRSARWANFAEVRADFGSADRIGDHVIFNIAGNKFRLAAMIFHDQQVLLVRGVYTHQEYDELRF